jgi:hypothetical protein
MRNFGSEEMTIALTDGVSILGRSFEQLRQLGFNNEILERISQGWAGFGASSYVLLVESTIPKHQRRLEKVDDLRGLVRRLLRAFVGYGAGGKRSAKVRMTVTPLESESAHKRKALAALFDASR